jgi:hypothetical protein
LRTPVELSIENLPQLTSAETKIIVALALHGREYTEPRIIMDEIGMSGGTLRPGLRQLVKWGWVECENRRYRSKLTVVDILTHLLGSLPRP